MLSIYHLAFSLPCPGQRNKAIIRALINMRIVPLTPRT